MPRLVLVSTLTLSLVACGADVPQPNHRAIKAPDYAGRSNAGDASSTNAPGTESQLPAHHSNPGATGAPADPASNHAPAATSGQGTASDGWKRPNPPADYADLTNPLANDAASLELGKRLYDTAYDNAERFLQFTACAQCHGMKANGKGPMAGIYALKPVDIRAQALKDASDGYIFWRLRSGPSARENSQMPAHTEDVTGLTDNDLWALVSYLRSLK